MPGSDIDSPLAKTGSTRGSLVTGSSGENTIEPGGAPPLLPFPFPLLLFRPVPFDSSEDPKTV